MAAISSIYHSSLVISLLNFDDVIVTSWRSSQKMPTLLSHNLINYLTNVRSKKAVSSILLAMPTLQNLGKSVYPYIYLSISHKTARVVRQTPSWSHRGADIVDCIILYNSYSFSACRWTTIPSHLVIRLLDWLQWWNKVAISSENVKISKFFYVPDEHFFSKKYSKTF